MIDYRALYQAFPCLNGDQVYVIAGLYWAGMSEHELARELTESRGVEVTRDRVHCIRRTAERKLLRAMQAATVVAGWGEAA